MKQKKETLWSKDFVLIIFVNLTLFFGFQMLLPTLPIFIKSIGESDSFVGWATGATTLAALLIRPFAGFALDRMNRRVIFIGGLLLMIASTVSYSFFPVAVAVLAIRFIHGLSFGISSTSSNTMATDIIPRHRFGEGMGFFSLSTSFGLALAPSIGLVIINALDFAATTYVAAGLVLVSISLSLMISRNEDPCPAPAQTKKFSPYEISSVRPALVMLFTAVCFGAVLGFISLYADSLMVENIGLFFTVCAASMFVTRPLIGKAIDRFGFNIAVFPGLAVMAASMLIISFSSSLMDLLLGAMLLGIGYSSAQNALQTMSVINAPHSRIGAANATFFTGLDGGICIGSVLGGVLSDAYGYGLMFLLLSSFIAAAAALYYILARNIKRQEPACEPSLSQE